ncbi:hypothetical protein ACFLQW_02455 [Candidatus Zixiibacteriota bacterium]
MKKARAYHHWLLALFPTLFLFNQNMNEYSLAVVVVPLALTLALVFALWLAFFIVSRNNEKAALISSLFVLLFFSYGHICDLLWYFFTVRPFTFREGANVILAPFSSVLFVVAVIWTVRTRRDLNGVTRWGNAVAIIIIIIQVLSIGVQAITSGGSISSKRGKEFEPRLNTSSETPNDLPDIYYLILDGFAREDVLADLYSYPNSALYNYLRRSGFYVGRRSGANYCQTMLSLASSLNYKYVKPEEDGFDPNSDDRSPLNRMVLRNRAVEFLRDQGYTIVALATGSQPTEMRNADIFLEPASKLWFLDEFQSGLLNTTPIPYLWPKMDHLPFFDRSISHPQAAARRELILRTFNLLAELPGRASPKFVFAHLVSPHPPFLFGPNGEPQDPPSTFTLADGNVLIGHWVRTREEYLAQYRAQLQFIEKKTIAAIEAILAHSARPPIIVLQADHGPGAYLVWHSSDKTDLRERLSILNAYYLPDGGDTLLYDTITPVNTFRVIFNHYFDQRLALLPDYSYFSLWKKPYWFIRVDDEVQGRAPDRPPATK